MEELISREKVANLLGVCDKKVTELVKNDGLPLALIGRSYRGSMNDLVDWIKSKYPWKYKEMLTNAKMQEKVVRTRGQFDSEEYGIAEKPNGQLVIVEGSKYVELCRDEYVDGMRLVQKRTRGTCSFEQTIREPVF
jgi:hypothetical protein